MNSHPMYDLICLDRIEFYPESPNPHLSDWKGHYLIHTHTHTRLTSRFIQSLSLILITVQIPVQGQEGTKMFATVDQQVTHSPGDTEDVASIPGTGRYIVALKMAVLCHWVLSPVAG